MLVLTNP